MISEALNRVSKNYLDAKLNSMSSSSLAPFINKISKEIVKPRIKKNREHYKYRSSCGQHSNWADVPWIATCTASVVPLVKIPDSVSGATAAIV